VLFRRLGDYAVMAMSVMSRHPTEDGVLAQIKTIVVDLLPPAPRVWVPRREATSVNALQSDTMGLTMAAVSCHSKSCFSWQRAIESQGVAGFRATQPQIFRDAPSARLAQLRH
jgi:hypothetical protein